MNLPHIPLRKAVTWEHIRTGIRDDCKKCPIALTLTEVLNPRCEIVVGTLSTIIARKEGMLSNQTKIHYHHNEDIKFWINDYDTGDFNIEPFTLIIDRRLKELRMEE